VQLLNPRVHDEGLGGGVELQASGLFGLQLGSRRSGGSPRAGAPGLGTVHPWPRETLKSVSPRRRSVRCRGGRRTCRSASVGRSGASDRRGPRPEQGDIHRRRWSAACGHEVSGGRKRRQPHASVEAVRHQEAAQRQLRLGDARTARWRARGARATATARGRAIERRRHRSRHIEQHDDFGEHRRSASTRPTAAARCPGASTDADPARLTRLTARTNTPALPTRHGCVPFLAEATPIAAAGTVARPTEGRITSARRAPEHEEQPAQQERAHKGPY
jgi:hypothetical protein